MFSLIENEVIKILFKKRLHVIFAILFILIWLFAYGESYTADKTKEQLSKRLGVSASADWKNLLEQQIIDQKSKLDNPYIPEEGKSSIRVRIEQLRYSLDNNMNPLESTAAKFTTKFMQQAIFLFLPLLIIILSGDLVSGEASNGTIKLLLSRSVPRWKLLLSKYLALMIMEVVVFFIAFILSLGISKIYFNLGGWMAPVATGFKVANGKLDTSGVINVPSWQYTLMVYALAYFVSLVVGSISFMISILVKSTSASIGIMMSTLVGGTFLSYFISDWEFTRYLFIVNLRLTDYLTGSFQPIQGMDMVFSVLVLGAWALASVLISFTYFIKHDVLV